jgi:hypothetical protein
MIKRLALFALCLSLTLPVNAQNHFAGDYDGDGFDDPVLYNTTTTTFNWMIVLSSTNYGVTEGLSWGLTTDIPIKGDFDFDGIIDPTVYRESTRMYYVLKSSCNYTCSRSIHVSEGI